jgi:hypothetical protein
MLPDKEITPLEVTKAGDIVRHGVTIRTEGSIVSPNIYIDDYFNDGVDPAVAAQKVYDTYIEHGNPNIGFDVSLLSNWNNAKNLLRIKLLNKERNEEYLADKVYFNYLDLVGVYYLYIDNGSSTPVTLHLLNNWGVDKKDLYDIAVENTRNYLPCVGKSMFETVMDITGGEMQDMPADVGMFVYTNKDRLFGATALLISDFGKTPKYILPSSMHEVIAISAEDNDINVLKTMVREVNDTEVDPSEILSYSVYYWDGEKVSVA